MLLNFVTQIDKINQKIIFNMLVTYEFAPLDIKLRITCNNENIKMVLERKFLKKMWLYWTLYCSVMLLLGAINFQKKYMLILYLIFKKKKFSKKNTVRLLNNPSIKKKKIAIQ